MKKSQERAIEQIIGESLVSRLEEEDISKNRVLHLYHETGRNKEFKEVVKNFFKNRKKPIDNINRQIETIQKERKQLKKIKEGLLQDYIREEI